MKFYRASWRDEEPTSQNCEWFTTKRTAEKEARGSRGRVVEVDVPTNRAGLLEFLNAKCWRA